MTVVGGHQYTRRPSGPPDWFDRQSQCGRAAEQEETHFTCGCYAALFDWIAFTTANLEAWAIGYAKEWVGLRGVNPLVS